MSHYYNRLIDKSAVFDAVVAHYGNLQQMSYALRISRQMLHKCKLNKCFTPRIAVMIERDTLGIFRAVDMCE